MSSFDADGFTLNWSTVSVSAQAFLYLLLGPALAAPIAPAFTPKVMVI